MFPNITNNCFGIQEQPNGEVWTGPIVNGKLNGDGKKKTKYGIEEGTFIDGKLTGIGKKTIHSQVYEGSFKNGYLDGFGTSSDENFKSVGEFKDNYFFKGRSISIWGTIKEGTFTPYNSVITGKEIALKCGLRCEKEFLNGKIINEKSFIPSSDLMKTWEQEVRETFGEAFMECICPKCLGSEPEYESESLSESPPEMEAESEMEAEMESESVSESE